MKTTDLMVCDWVLIPDYQYAPATIPARVTMVNECNALTVSLDGGDCIFNGEEVEPIPLTPEILEKNGFDRCDNFFGKTCYAILKHDTKVMVFVIPNEYYWLEVNITQKYTMLYGLKMRIKFVHELQHALWLCRVGKEIVL